MHGTLLFAHGARDAAWARPFEAIAQQMQALRPDQPLALAYLELMQPDIGSAAATLIAAGCRHITVVPLFLGAGGHVRRDLPERLAELSARHPEVQFSATLAIGEAPQIVQAIATAAVQLVDAAR
ncbi:MAG: sirohydrochlorin chelatase [Leptothrix sp. (in: b-proteobacteria)]